MLKPFIPDGEALRRAFSWLAEEGHCTLKTVEKASLQFDLTPSDEEFLLRQFVYHRGVASDLTLTKAIVDSHSVAGRN